MYFMPSATFIPGTIHTKTKLCSRAAPILLLCALTHILEGARGKVDILLDLASLARRKKGLAAGRQPHDELIYITTNTLQCTIHM